MLTRLFWTFGAFGGTFLLRFGTNFVVSRLLTPEVFGIMVVVNSLRYGIELLTDVGIEQNIVRHKDGLTPPFFNTAWTMQMIRGAGLAVVFLALAWPLSVFYAIDWRVFAAISLAPLLNSFHSTAIFALVKGLEVRRRNLFELTADTVTAAATILLAWLSPTVWALVLAVLVSIAARSAISYSLPHEPHRLTLRRDYVREILSFGKWIAISSLVVYLASNADRITLGKLVPLALLGVYGMARTLAEIPVTLANRLSYQLVFPALAAAKERDAAIARHDVARPRWRFLLLGAVALGTGVAWADVAIAVLFDPRYHAAGWMLSLLLVAAGLSVLATLSEALLLGFDRPALISAGNVVRILILLPGLPLGWFTLGLVGAIGAVIVAEAARYVVVGFGQRLIGFSFWRQDAGAALVAAAVTAAWVLLRHGAGLGGPLAAMAGR